MLHLPRVLDAEQIALLRTIATRAPWIDGRTTAGGGAVERKHNEQVDETSADGAILADLEVAEPDPVGVRLLRQVLQRVHVAAACFAR